MKTIPLTQGKVTIVDDEDYSSLAQWKWCYSSNGYAERSSPRPKKILYMHRVITNTPKGMQTDHINGDRLDNRRSNLRVCSSAENRCNTGKMSTNKSGYKGVIWDKKSEKWMSRICFRGKQIYLGLFVDVIQAAEACDAAVKKLHGEFAKLNFPD